MLADTVWLKNGDKLSGKIIRVRWRQAVGPDRVRRCGADRLEAGQDPESDQELLVKQDAYTGEKAKSLHAAEDGKVTLENGEAPKTVELASVQQILKPKPVVEDLRVKGQYTTRRWIISGLTKIPTTTTSTSRRHGASWSMAAHREGEYNREFRMTDGHYRQLAASSRSTASDRKWFRQGRRTS